MLTITVTNRNTSDRKSYKFTQNAILIGRQQNCDIMLESSAVSRRHSKITVNKSLVEIEDLGSGNGTLVNQKKIPSKEAFPIKPGDQIRIEEFEIQFENTEIADLAASATFHKSTKTEITDPDMIEIKMIKKVLGALDQDKLPSLVMTSQEFKNKKAIYEEGTDQLVIGRDPDCQLSLNSQVVSRRHAIVSIKWGGFVITDLESKNGTFVNGERITEKTLKDGDEIVFGTLKAIFKNPQEFNIDSISRSIEDEKKKSEKKFEDTASFERSAINTASDKVSAAGLASTDAKEPKAVVPETAKDNAAPAKADGAKDKTSEPEKKAPGKESDKKAEPKKDNSETKSTQKEEPKEASKKPFASFSTSEKILFGFGAFVILVVLIVLIRLFV